MVWCPGCCSPGLGPCSLRCCRHRLQRLTAQPLSRDCLHSQRAVSPKVTASLGEAHIQQQVCNGLAIPAPQLLPDPFLSATEQLRTSAQLSHLFLLGAWTKAPALRPHITRIVSCFTVSFLFCCFHCLSKNISICICFYLEEASVHRLGLNSNVISTERTSCSKSIPSWSVFLFIFYPIKKIHFFPKCLSHYLNLPCFFFVYYYFPFQIACKRPEGRWFISLVHHWI